jgi:hypothetical protein
MSDSSQSSNGKVRKHFYLITEHEKDDRVGGVSIMNSQLSRPLKNQEGPVTVLDDEIEDFREVGKQVGLGYYDFEHESRYEDNDHLVSVMKKKLAEIDEHWLRKAGLEPDELLSDTDRTD